MIAHVAEAGESRGRVVVRTTRAQVSDIAIQAAVRIAQAFRSEIECLYVVDTELLALARFPFVREIRADGRGTRPITQADVARDLNMQFAGLQRRLAKLAHASQVNIHERFVRDEPLRALAVTCADCGPWNVVVLAEPFGAKSAQDFARLLDSVPDATGMVVVGPRAIRTTGPVVLVLEAIDTLPGLLRAGERLVEGTDTALIVAIVTPDRDTADWLDAHARLAIPETSTARLIKLAPAHVSAAAVAEELRKLKAGLVLAQFGMIAVPADESLAPLAAALECPLLLSR